ncbi:MAG: hypothetical protein IJE48_05935 [Clostridia bacterium]|nr:hypothetical protein [Clostridia bacterium]
MIPNNQFREYKRIMGCIDVEESVKQQIIRNCARHSTLNKIKSGKYKLIAVIKNSEMRKY